ncbi:hypothetical protein L2E82_23100 [Cichorium intybus]|uniref:Uncharacterized protein n=1 Tax=Cichorium intybus TaxID=13427 RepID=A0ACB9DZW6_CICIN|nr:hypothetical protein L2E82_23100 [Cichorium intybus]
MLAPTRFSVVRERPAPGVRGAVWLSFLSLPDAHRDVSTQSMAKQPMLALVDGIVTDNGGLLPYLLLLMLLLILIIILIACRPWRFFARNYRSRTIKATTSSDVQDVERPLISQDSDEVESNITEHHRDSASEGPDGHLSAPQNHGHVHKHRLPPRPRQVSHGDSLILDISDPSESVVVGQTLKRPLVINESDGEQIYGRKEDLSNKSDNDSSRPFISKPTADQRSILTLEVISGPSCGARYSIQSTNKSKLPLTLGRVSPSDVLVTDSEVSGKHAKINWNLNKLKWEVVDMGSLNGTLLNSKAVHHPETGSRHWGDPVELNSGDIITLGTTSKISVEIASEFNKVPFGVGVVSDPMSVRRGGKKLPMEDVCYYHWPLPGTHQFGLFGICDGHGGAAAASSASKIMPEMVTRILSDTLRREKVFSHGDASDVLREAFSQTEAHMDHLYEGCTATVVLVWGDGHDNYFAQCANVGDSACIANVRGQQIKMSEDHRVGSYNERMRIQATGEPLKDGETRLCGLNLARMLGDKFLKQQDARFSSEPYISQVVCMNSETQDFAIIASDGFWDVVNSKKAIQLVHQAREKNSAEKIAKVLLSEARAQRTKDNTSIIFLDFDTNHYCKHGE